jgi:hypothetical protein
MTNIDAVVCVRTGGIPDAHEAADRAAGAGQGRAGRTPSATGIDARQRRDHRAGAQSTHRSMQESVMQALKELFTTDVGLMSVGGIAFMLGMAVFFVRYFIRHMREDEARARR